MATQKEVDDLFDDKNIPQSNWFKFEKVGDRISGEVVSVSDKPASGEFKEQRVWGLKQKDGDVVNVGISKEKDYIMGRTGSVQLGDILGFEFKKEIPPSKKGFRPAKSIEVYVKHVERTEESV